MSFVKGGWLSTDWHGQVYQSLSLSEWNLFGRSDSKIKRKNEVCDRDRMAIGHRKTALSPGPLAIEVPVIVGDC